MELFRQKSYDDVSVDEICALAGVGRATFFRAFDTKAHLLVEFNRRLAARVSDRLAVAQPKKVEDALRIVGDEIADTWTQTAPEAANLAMDFTLAGSRKQLHSAHPELLAVVVGLIESAMVSKQLRSTLPPNLVGSLALVMITAPVAYWFRHPELDLHGMVNEAITHWLNGAMSKK